MPENNQQNQQPDQLSNGIGQNYQEPQANNEN
jgi:hypothetical protein